MLVAEGGEPAAVIEAARPRRRRRGRARGDRRAGDRRQPGRRREDPRRQGPGDRRDHRRRHARDQGPRGRRRGAAPDPRAHRLSPARAGRRSGPPCRAVSAAGLEVALPDVAGHLTADPLTLLVRGPEVDPGPDARVDDSSIACEKRVKLRACRPRSCRSSAILSVPKNCCSVSTIEPLKPVCPEGCSGYGGVGISGSQPGSGSVRGLPSVPASRIAVIGRQNDQCALSSQTADQGVRRGQVQHREEASVVDERQAAAPTAAGRCGSTSPAGSRPSTARPCRSARRVRCCRSPSRASLTSSNSRAYLRLVSAIRPLGAELRRALDQERLHVPEPGDGSFTNVGSTGRHTPGSGPRRGSRAAPKRPSSVRAAIIAAAAASPTAIPRFFERPSGIAASDDVSCASSAGCCAGTRWTRTRWAAVAAAASLESVGRPTLGGSR